MTLFISRPNRTLMISDVYVMGLAFLLGYSVAIITKSVYAKLKKNKEDITVANPRGGAFRLSFQMKMNWL